MASHAIDQYLPKTTLYIDSDTVSLDRAGHHNFVIEQEIGSTFPYLCDKNKNQLKKFDERMLNLLRDLDIPECDR